MFKKIALFGLFSIILGAGLAVGGDLYRSAKKGTPDAFRDISKDISDLVSIADAQLNAIVPKGTVPVPPYTPAVYQTYLDDARSSEATAVFPEGAMFRILWYREQIITIIKQHKLPEFPYGSPDMIEINQIWRNMQQPDQPHRQLIRRLLTGEKALNNNH